MLSDPIVAATGSTPTGFSAGTPCNFRRIGNGRYVATDGAFSLDQPARLSIRPNASLTGNSSLSYRVERDKNVPAVNGVAQKDRTARVEIKFSGDVSVFTAAELKDLGTIAYAKAIETFDRAFAGES